MRILICDDNRDTAITLGMLFHGGLHEVYLCHDGGSYRESATLQAQIALLDIGLPGLDRYKVAQAIRQMEFEKTY